MATDKREILRDIIDKTTQREKLLVGKRLEMPFSEVIQDEDLALTALAWLKVKHESGGADWDRILDMTDTQILDTLGLNDEEAEEAAGEDETPTDSGAETRLTSV